MGLWCILHFYRLSLPHKYLSKTKLMLWQWQPHCSTCQVKVRRFIKATLIIFKVSVCHFVRFCKFMELLRKGKAQYSWPPFTNLIRSAAFDNTNIIYFFTQQTTLMKGSTVQSLPLHLVFPYCTYSVDIENQTNSFIDIYCCFVYIK
jgi:hypothetical protein